MANLATNTNPINGTWDPGSSIAALLDRIARVKFSTHVPLAIVLISIVYAVYRSGHWLQTALHLQPAIAWPTAVFLECLVLGGSAAVFISQRAAYVAELKNEDRGLADFGGHISIVLLLLGFVALLGVAGADAMLATSNDLGAALIMVLAQATQALLIIVMIVWALLDERAALRAQHGQYLLDKAGRCRFCNRPMSGNNLARHERTCRANPANTP